MKYQTKQMVQEEIGRIFDEEGPYARVLVEKYGDLALAVHDDLSATIAAQAAKIERLKAALTQAEDIYAGMVGSADRIGELLFGCYADADPTSNGKQRYWPACAVFLPILDAEKVARLINEMMDVDWVHVDGEVGQ